MNTYDKAFNIAKHYGLVEEKHGTLARFAARKTDKGFITLAQTNEGHLQLSYVADEQGGDFALIPIALSKEQLDGGHIAVEDMEDELRLFVNDKVLSHAEERQEPDRNASDQTKVDLRVLLERFWEMSEECGSSRGTLQAAIRLQEVADYCTPYDTDRKAMAERGMQNISPN